MNYLLIGQEEYLRRQFLEKLRSSIINSGTAQPDFEIFHTDCLTDILNSCNTLPFISKEKLVVIKDIDRFSSKEKDSILKYLRSPRETTTLVLESPSGSFNKFLEDVSKLTKVVRCDRLKGGELGLWIRRQFAVRKKNISQCGADLIEELIGNDLLSLENEIEKILSFIGDADEVTERQIETVLGKVSYRTSFELVGFILDKKTDKLLASIDDLLVREKPHQILNLIAWQFRSFIKIKDLPRGLSAEEAADRLGINSYFARKLIEQSKRFIRSDLERNLEIILEADFAVKTGKADPRHAVEEALVRLLL
ncbi:MAG: DNA polymerase III subunit delta [Omnitrophica bacterium RBG_13_46_9]|nr:MAG: DNA polymerase III subunit delta [Omnitrophica bacterium RBG_13_46_9]